jgi:DNA-binding GntR family transcriptional regulator
MILDGRLLPGEPLREAALASALGVSRGPLREAFRGLEEKGLVRTRRNCGVQVRSLSLDEADQIYELRIALEEMIGRKVAERREADSLQRLTAVLAEMQRAVDATNIGRYVRLNVSFHDELARGSGNAKLHETYSRLVAELSLSRRQAYLHDSAAMRLSLREHGAIFDAVRAGDGELAGSLLRGHAFDSRLRLHQALEPDLTPDLTVQLQATRVLPFMRGPAHGADGGAPGGPRHPASSGTPVGAVTADPAAPAAGRTAQAGDAGTAGGAPRDHAAPAWPGWAQA